ncbi:hypothetical protein [Flavobacterium terrisoli]|uniref:hypothetical protein n=1 Tax=Flavobacterium terrisoli TaxID=3242195 RepID=UPI002543E32D|nr:hypothetical protein [Flavobacterium buctense]
MNKFKILFFTLLTICILTVIVAFNSFDYVETNLAHEITMKYFSLPILLIMFPVCLIIYLKFLVQHEGKKYTKKIWTNVRTIFRIITLTIGMTVVLYATTLSIIMLTNDSLGENETIVLNAKIVDYYSMESSGTIRHYIKIQDPKLNRSVKLKVNKPYLIGEKFNKKMKVGYWGLLYSEK